ncbi:MAG: J domain-containing protein [Candidatus Peregrinibacteria bacterium]
MKNLYTILELKPGVSPEDIKRAYYLRAKQYHPDSGNKAELKKFYEVTEAYQILSDVARRAAYDETLKTGKLEKTLLNQEPLETPLEYSRPTHGQDFAYRHEEMTHFRSRLLWMAFFKVLITIIVSGVIGSTFAILFESSRFLGSFAGAAFGLIWAVHHHFDVASFIPSAAHYRLARWGGILVMILSAGYFAALFLKSLLA